MANLALKLSPFLLALGLAYGQSSIQLSDDFNQQNPSSSNQNFSFTWNWLSGYRYKPGFRIDGAKTDFFIRPYIESKSFYDARAVLENKERTMSQKTFEDLSQKFGWKDIIFDFLVLEDSTWNLYDFALQSLRCNHFVLRDDYGTFYYPYMDIDYPGVQQDSAGVPVDFRDPPLSEGFWMLFNGEKSKEMRIGRGFSSKRKVFYLISVKKRDKEGIEREYKIETNGKDVFERFRLSRNRVYVLVSDDGNDFGIGALEDLVQK
jgi:hypothetical protein